MVPLPQFAIEILRKTAQLVRCFLMTSDDLRRLPANLKTTIIAPCLPGRCRDERAESVLADRLKAVTGHGPGRSATCVCTRPRVM